MEPAGQTRWSSPAAWFQAASEFVAEACTTLSAMIALLLLVVLWPKAVMRVMGLLLPPARADRNGSLRLMRLQNIATGWRAGPGLSTR